MSYSNNPLLPKARAEAVRLVVEQQLPVAVAARKSGINRTTLWRWKQRWLEVNENVQLENNNRPNRKPGSKFRLAACTWRIPTASSRPHGCKHAVSDAVVDRIRYYRQWYNRCAVIVHAYCLREGTKVSLSTVRRVLRRLGFVARKHYNKKWRPPVERPKANKPGDLWFQRSGFRSLPLARRRLACVLSRAPTVMPEWQSATLPLLLRSVTGCWPT